MNDEYWIVEAAYSKEDVETEGITIMFGYNRIFSIEFGDTILHYYSVDGIGADIDDFCEDRGWGWLAKTQSDKERKNYLRNRAVTIAGFVAFRMEFGKDMAMRYAPTFYDRFGFQKDVRNEGGRGWTFTKAELLACLVECKLVKEGLPL